MIGAIVGDVLGSFYETSLTKAKDFALFHELDRFTDDTVLTVAVALAILESSDDAGVHRRCHCRSILRWCSSETARLCPAAPG